MDFGHRNEYPPADCPRPGLSPSRPVLIVGRPLADRRPVPDSVHRGMSPSSPRTAGRIEDSDPIGKVQPYNKYPDCFRNVSSIDQ